MYVNYIHVYKYVYSSSTPFDLHLFLFSGLVRAKGLGHFYYTSQLSKDFQRSKESHFWSNIPVIIVPNLR